MENTFCEWQLKYFPTWKKNILEGMMWNYTICYDPDPVGGMYCLLNRGARGRRPVVPGLRGAVSIRVRPGRPAAFAAGQGGTG